LPQRDIRLRGDDKVGYIRRVIVTPSRFQPLVVLPEGCEAITFVFRGGELLVRADDCALPDSRACAVLALDPASVHPVGALDDAYFRAAHVPRDAQPIEGFEYTALRRLWGRLDDSMLALAGRAYQIAEWARTHRFCGACAGPMTHMPGERAMKCASCGHQAYPRISPAMMVLVKRGASILLAHNAAAPPGRFSALAGFVEPGESIEDAIHREVHEEVGLQVKDLRYFGSQSWPFPHSLMIAFTAEYAGGEITLHDAEIDEARWFGPDDPLPQLSPSQSISRALIDANLPEHARM
jgi:NAD+ diphosphatase